MRKIQKQSNYGAKDDHEKEYVRELDHDVEKIYSSMNSTFSVNRFEAAQIATQTNTAWTLGKYTAGGATTSGYITISIQGVNYKLLCST